MIGVKELIARRKQVAGEVDDASKLIMDKIEAVIDDGLVESADRGLSEFTMTLNPKDINDEIRDLWYESQEKYSMSKYDLIMAIVKKYRDNGFRVSKEKTHQDFYKFEFLEPRPKLEPIEDPEDVSKDSVNEDGTVNTGSQTHFTTDGGTQTDEEGVSTSTEVTTDSGVGEDDVVKEDEGDPLSEEESPKGEEGKKDPESPLVEEDVHKDEEEKEEKEESLEH